MKNFTKNTHKSDGPPNTFLCKITIPDNPTPRTLPNCKVWNGVVVQLISVGKGKKVEKGGMNAYGEGETWEEWVYYAYVPMPLFCKKKFKSVLEENQAMALMERLHKKKDYTEAFSLYKHAMFVLGDNGYGYIVEDYEQAKADAQRSGRQAINVVPALFGLKIQDRLPTDLWAKVKPYAEFTTYEQADDYQEDCIGYPKYEVRDLMGWHYKPEAITTLLQAGCHVTYRGESITDPTQMQEIDDRIDAKHQEIEEKRLAWSKQKQTLMARLPGWDAWELMTDDQVKAMQHLLMLTFLDWTGPTIYGGGTWAHVDDEYFYRIDNNGADGDNWSYNNYETGGAGAIAYRTPMTDEIRRLLADIDAFKKQS